MEQIDPSFMSDEEDGEEDTAGSWVVRSPPWRSPRLSALLKDLQQRVDGATSSHPKNPRVPGEPSDRSPPSDSPAWALADRENREGSLESPPPASPSSASHHPASPQSSPRRSLFSDGEDDADDSSSDEQRVLAPSPVIRNKSRRVRPIRD